MGLLMVGFGLRDSIMAIGEKQFGEIRIYSGAVNLDMSSSEEERKQVLETVQRDPQVTEWMEALESSVDVGYGDKEKSSYMVVASDLEKFSKFVNLKNRISKEVYELDEDGVIITEKLAKLLSVEEGDTIYLKDGETKRVEIPVSHIVENYFYHYVYMSLPYMRNYMGKRRNIRRFLLSIRKIQKNLKKHFRVVIWSLPVF